MNCSVICKIVHYEIILYPHKTNAYMSIPLKILYYDSRKGSMITSIFKCPNHHLQLYSMLEEDSKS